MAFAMDDTPDAVAAQAARLAAARFDCGESELRQIERQLARTTDDRRRIHAAVEAALARNLAQASPARIAGALAGLRRQHAAAAAREVRQLRRDAAAGRPTQPGLDDIRMEIAFLRAARADLSRRILRLEATMAVSRVALRAQGQ